MHVQSSHQNTHTHVTHTHTHTHTQGIHVRKTLGCPEYTRLLVLFYNHNESLLHITATTVKLSPNSYSRNKAVTCYSRDGRHHFLHVQNSDHQLQSAHYSHYHVVYRSCLFSLKRLETSFIHFQRCESSK